MSSLGSLLRRFPRLELIEADSEDADLTAALTDALRQHGPFPSLERIMNRFYAYAHDGVPFSVLSAAAPNLVGVHLRRGTAFLGRELDEWDAFINHLKSPEVFPALQALELDVDDIGPTFLAQLHETLRFRCMELGRPPLTSLKLDNVYESILQAAREILCDSTVCGQLCSLLIRPRFTEEAQPVLSLAVSYLEASPRPALTTLSLYLDPQAPSLGESLPALLKAGRAPALRQLHLHYPGTATALELRELLKSAALPSLHRLCCHILANMDYSTWEALACDELNELVQEVSLLPPLSISLPGAHPFASSRGFVDAVLARSRFPNLTMLDLEDMIVGEGADSEMFWDDVLHHLGDGGGRWPALNTVYVHASTSDSILQRLKAALPATTVVRMPR